MRSATRNRTPTSARSAWNSDRPDAPTEPLTVPDSIDDDASFPAPDPQVVSTLARAGLIAGGPPVFTPLTGGVSSDIWKVETGGRVFCVKRARSRLRVEADWRAPVERNRFEVEWYRLANSIAPAVAPRVLYHDETAQFFAMEFLDERTHRLWKPELMAGRSDPLFAAAVGRSLAAIHAGTAGRPEIESRFPRGDIFQAIRLRPYLEATASRHPDLSDALFALSARTSATRLALVHGDISPKNILVGPDGPVFLDAECACWGDPAFDLAFCLNHFLLKCLCAPDARDGFARGFQEMASAYLKGVDWEPPAALEARAASLLPALFLARVDGTSPVEYVTREADKERVRGCARPLVDSPPAHLRGVLDAWREALAR